MKLTNQEKEVLKNLLNKEITRTEQAIDHLEDSIELLENKENKELLKDIIENINSKQIMLINILAKLK